MRTICQRDDTTASKNCFTEFAFFPFGSSLFKERGSLAGKATSWFAGGFLLLIFSVSPHVCFILDLILISMSLR